MENGLSDVHQAYLESVNRPKPIITMRRLLVGSAVLLALSAWISACGPNVEQSDPSPQYGNWNPEAEYVGREACQPCHPDKYASFVESQMGRSWKAAKLSNSDANFVDPEPIFSPVDDLYYLPFHRGEDLFVQEYRIVEGDTVHSRIEQIDYIVGSGQHTNSHIYSEKGFLYQIPITFYVQEGRWDLAPGFRNLNTGFSRFTRPIPEACMTCHNGYSPIEPGSENRFLDIAEGIGCEMCHGPGSVHIAAIKAGIAVDISKEIDYTIVNPGKLPPERELDVCARCHMQAVDVFKTSVSPQDFRPGQALSDYEQIFWPRQPDSVEVFNMASHPDRLGMSRCFASSWKEGSSMDPITCTTCHDPHVSIEKRGPEFYTSICLSCHESQAVAACTEPTVAANPETQACASCHMPTSETDDIPHVRITDHFIRTVRSTSDAASMDSDDRKRIIRLASMVGENPSQSELALGFLNYFEKIEDRPQMLELAAEALQKARREEPPENLVIPSIQLWYLSGDYDAIIRYADRSSDDIPEHAWTLFRVGDAFSQAGDHPRAADYFRRSVTLAPGYLGFKDRLASAYTNAGDNETAISLFNEILELNPKFEPAVNNRGFAYLVSGDFEAAEKDFRRAIALDPDAEVALANLASLYLNTDRKEAAFPLVVRLLEISPFNQRYRRLWAALTS